MAQTAWKEGYEQDSSGSTADSDRPRKRRKVAFSTLDIVELAYTLGDNPSVGRGAPIACGNHVQERICFEVDYFEQHRPKRRYNKELILSKSRREAL